MSEIGSSRLFFNSYFDHPNLVPATALRCAIEMLRRSRLDPDRYMIDPGHGSRRDSRPHGHIYSAEQILEEVRMDMPHPTIGGGFFVRAIRGNAEQMISMMPSFPRIPFQSFIVGSTPGLGVSEFHELVKAVSQSGRLGFAGARDGHYLAWQRCDDPASYRKNHGPVTGFRIVRHEMHPPIAPIERLDTSMNPGRIDITKKLPVFVSADMWLGCAFWKYAPCTKEEILKEPWLEVEERERYLYLKAYPEPFTRPDGEQGRLQRRLWNVLFHQDCEWPPGCGTMAG
jgi:hypothetical protein